MSYASGVGLHQGGLRGGALLQGRYWQLETIPLPTLLGTAFYACDGAINKLAIIWYTLLLFCFVHSLDIGF